MRRFLPFLGLTAAALLAWANSFSGPFVFDDRPAILANPSLESFGAALSPPRDGGTVAGRPLVNLSLALNRALGGPAVGGYHAVNLLIHVLAGLTLFGLVRRTLEPRGDALLVAFSAALLWLVHPLQTAAVTYVIQRAESLMALCFLATVYAFRRSCVSEFRSDTDPSGAKFDRRWRTVSVVACLAGMAAKEVMVVAPLVVLLYDRTFIAGSFAAALRARRSYYAALAATWLPLAALVADNASRAGTAGFGSNASPLDYALTQCGAIVTYLKLAVWPAPLMFDYGTALVTRLSDVWLQAVLIAGFVAATGLALLRRPRLGFLGAAFLLILAPSSSFVPVATQTVAEHRMYLPLAALAIGASLALHAALRTRATWGAVGIALALGTATFHRNRDYVSAAALWRDTVAKRPDNPRAHNHLGNALAQEGRPAEAVPHYQAALRLAPGEFEVHNNLGGAFAALGQQREAVEHYSRAHALRPDFEPVRINLANALVDTARTAPPNDAAGLYRRAIELHPAHAAAHYNLGVGLARQRAYPEAAVALQAAVRHDPKHVGARVNLGNVLLLTGRRAEAAIEYEAALQLKPGDPQIAANLALARRQ